MPSPTVTVIIPTYNWSTVLPYSIGSVLWQTFTDFELMVIGDGCTDDSEAVVRGINDPRVRWLNLPANTGAQSGPNNAGLREARGEVIAYLGHDDLWFPHHLACLLHGINQGPPLAFGITALFVNPDGPPKPAVPMGEYRTGMWMPPTGVMHKRSVIERVGGWRDFRELKCDPEADLWARASTEFGNFASVLRLTALKFPAAKRKDIYKQRPNHEQATWAQRIRTVPHLEASILARMLMADQKKAMQSQITTTAEEDLGPGERIRQRRVFKGLDPEPGKPS
jgi:glycosyltransferase involved in cell wall biosynthesis